MIIIHLRTLQHRAQSCIGIFFRADKVIVSQLRSIKDLRWSKTHRCWYVPANKANYKKIKQLFPATQIKDYTVWAVDNNELSQGSKFSQTLDRHQDTMALYQQTLVLKGYSPNTIRTYCNEFRQFLSIIKNNDPASFSTDRLKDYFFYCFNNLKLSENTLHSRINALKFYYEQVLKKEKLFWDIPRPKKPLLLPKLLNEDELMRLFNSLTNKKHKAILFTAYSSGLRVSEIVNLKISDIDAERMQIRIARAKGKKDRYVNLSPVLLDILRQYIKLHQPRPKVYLFESDQTRKAYPARTVQQIFSNAKSRAGILKEVGIHSLRHSFATHLLEKGTDIKYIKDILGHFNIKTTERYLHVSKQKLVNIISPFDDLWRTNNLEW